MSINLNFLPQKKKFMYRNTASTVNQNKNHRLRLDRKRQYQYKHKRKKKIEQSKVENKQTENGVCLRLDTLTCVFVYIITMNTLIKDEKKKRELPK